MSLFRADKMNVESTQAQPFDPLAVIATEREVCRTLVNAQFGDGYLTDAEFAFAWSSFSLSLFADPTRAVVSNLRSFPLRVVLTPN